ncbi:MAG: hypothetical protein WD278_14350 [Pirellulales bacterium]
MVHRPAAADTGRSWRLLVLALLAVPGGCSREHYRRQADRDSYAAVAGATGNPRYCVRDFTIDVDPRARFFDPFDPDRPPMPPDDPESHRLMHYVDGKRGAPGWHSDGDVADIELSSWQAYLPYDDQGAVVIDREGAVELARLHSRDYQEQLETLYLSALDVTFERFRFDAQFFGGNRTLFNADGRLRGAGGSSSLLTTDTDLEVRRLTATGGELVAGLANSIVWQFAGPDTNFHSSILNFSLLQPLLRFGGRARVLERLTLAERGLLGNVRQLERYRQGFYVEVTTGRGGGGGLSRRGGFFGGAGLEGFSGVGGGGFGRVGGFGLGGGGGLAGGGGVGAAQAGGLMGMLQDQQGIRNQEANVVGLRDSLAQLEAAYDAGRLENRFQVDFARQALYTGQSQLLNNKAAYEANLDDYKIELGLPPDVNLVVSDPLLDRFNLIDSAIVELQNEIAGLLDLVRNPELAAGQAELENWLGRLPAIREEVEAHLELVARDLENFESGLADRRAALVRLQNLPEVERGDLDATLFDPAQLDRRLEAAQRDYARLLAELAATWQQADQLIRELPGIEPSAARTRLARLVTQLSGRLLELSLLQARARLDVVGVVPIELEPEAALAIALENRPDWMNAKANLVDTWRLIRFNANALRSGLDVTLSGDLGTTGNNPVQFRDSTGRLTAGLEFDAPLTRLSERNVYRQALIEYQQQRRALMQFRDRIHQGLRNTLRQVELNEVNFELRRAAVLVAIGQVDLARLKLSQPPRPGETSEFGDTTARDLVDALGNLAAAQNNFLSVWVNYEVQRMSLDFDLGTMLLDDRGIWIDPGPITAETQSLRGGHGHHPAELLPPGLEMSGESADELPPPVLAAPHGVE